LFQLQPRTDWITHEGTVLAFDQSLVGQGGGLDLEVRSAATRVAGEKVGVQPGSALAPGRVVVAPAGSKAGVLTVVGGGGLNSILRKNLSQHSAGLNAGLIAH